MDAGGDQEADGEDLGHGDVEGDLPDWGLTHQGSLDDRPWQGHEPADVSSVEDLSDTWVLLLGGGSDVVVLGSDRDPTQVGSDGEVCDTHEDTWGDGSVVSQSVVSGLSEHQQDHDDGAEEHYTEYSPCPVGTTAGDVEVSSGRRVNLDGLVTASLVQVNVRHFCCCGYLGSREVSRLQSICFI